MKPHIPGRAWVTSAAYMPIRPSGRLNGAPGHTQVPRAGPLIDPVYLPLTVIALRTKKPLIHESP